MTINANKRCVRVTRAVNGDVVNNAIVGDASSEGPGFFIGGKGLLTGALINNGTIKGGGDGFGALTLGHDADVQGGIRNNGTIVSTNGNAINLGYRAYDHGWRTYAAALSGDIANGGLIDGNDFGVAALYGTMTGTLINEAGSTIKGRDAAVYVAGSFASWSGGIENSGDILGKEAGILIGTPDDEAEGGVVFSGGIVNFAGGEIASSDGIAIWIMPGAASFAGGIVNRGTIAGERGGISVESATFYGGLFNAATGSISAEDGDAVFSGGEWFGGVDNRGRIEGSRYGFGFAGPVFHGDVVNAGTIEGGHTGVRLAGTDFDGGFNNSGAIGGGVSGVAYYFDKVFGGFLNSGAIDGGSAMGVDIHAGDWGTASAHANIVNSVGGVITGGTTGFSLIAQRVYGDFVNNGTIKGFGANTGISITASTYTGDIENNGEAEAVSNAVYLDIDTLNGAVINTGTIKATGTNGVAVVLDIGDGTRFTNADGGLILGGVQLRGPASNIFAANRGGLEGDLTGNAGASPLPANDDRLIVEDGAHYFVNGIVRNFLNFDINDGGTALMGARFVGDGNGPGYGSSNISALNVNSGGRLYLDDDTILNVGSFSQSAGGELTFFLSAPAGTPVVGSDYGRVNASGAVALAGTLSLILDPASFGGTTQTTFSYVDIIKGSSFDGEFDQTLIEGNSYFFTLALSYGDTSLDLTVTRTPFDQAFCVQHQSQNSAEFGAALEAAFQAGGFSPEQIELFNWLGQLDDVCGAYYDLGGAVLGDIQAITIETAGPWKSAVNDRLNSTGATSCVVAGAGGCLTRYAQNGAGGTLSDAEDPFAWLRTGVRPEGQMSFWGRLIGVQGDNQGRGGSSGSDFTVTGGIAGADYVFSQRFIAGVAAQWTTTDVDFKHRRDTADVQSLEVGGYFSYGDVDFCVNGNASIIFHDFDTYRYPFDASAHASYHGRTMSAYAEAGKVFEFDLLRVEPIAALSFASLSTDDYKESGTAGGNLLFVQGADHLSLKSFLGSRVAYPFALSSGRKIVPEARVMWGHEFLDDQAEFTAALASLPNNRFTVRGQRFSRDSLILGAGLNVPMSAEAAIYADYDLSLTPDQMVQSVSLGARVSW